MDKSKRYAKILKEIFDEYKELDERAARPKDQNINSIFVIEENKGVFGWFGFGWTKQGRVNSINVFVRLHDGKIHIEEDWTETGIGTILLAKGVATQDLVVEFHPPEMRQYTDFATA